MNGSGTRETTLKRDRIPEPPEEDRRRPVVTTLSLLV